ncbi:MAG: rRNA-binding ribosome biosynthesis protein utp25 [Peltula sp. TS41687]|nr:MAG: rRNA-binding ribosome biosynthesis protein utp25 [Peltula sp. TS41687]
MANHYRKGAGNQRMRGRGGRARGKRGGAKNIQSNRFHTTRVEEPGQRDDQESIHSPEESEEPISDAEESSSEEEQVGHGGYTSLLQALHAHHSQGSSARKRRKLDHQQSSSDRQEVKKDLLDNHAVKVIEDRVPEQEERADDAETEASDHSSVDDSIEGSDPFEVHFASPDDIVLSQRLSAIAQNSWQTHKTEYGNSYKSALMMPEGSQDAQHKAKLHLARPKSLKLKPRLAEKAVTNWSEFDALESIVAPLMFMYMDVLFCTRTLANGHSLRKLSCLHLLNHVLKTRDRVIKNNARKSKHDDTDDLELRDQGFTRPKVLIILPTRQSCVNWVGEIAALYGSEQQENRKRFEESYVQETDDVPSNKPDDFQALFGGNDDDLFRIGLKFTRKSLKFFSQFYNSDIIIASPLGLRTSMGSEDKKKNDYDFLSSIELVIVDQADALMMQNWENVEYIFDHVNRQPKEAHGCDFSRVREWYLDGNAKHLRQTVIFSAFNTPDLNLIFSNHMKNIAGKAKISRDHDGAMLGLDVQLKQTFTRFESPIPAMDPEARFKYFTTAVITNLNSRLKSSSSAAGTPQGILIFIPSYFDFVRVRNYFSTSTSTQHISFGSISEYTSVKEVARARSHFFSGRHSTLLYTERAHHFRRYHLRGVKSVIMYGLPDNPIFYREIVGGYLAASMKEGRLDPSDARVRSIFSRWDAMKLERIVGSRRVVSLLREKGGDRFDFV